MASRIVTTFSPSRPGIHGPVICTRDQTPIAPPHQLPLSIRRRVARPRQTPPTTTTRALSTSSDQFRLCRLLRGQKDDGPGLISSPRPRQLRQRVARPRPASASPSATTPPSIPARVARSEGNKTMMAQTRFLDLWPRLQRFSLDHDDCHDGRTTSTLDKRFHTAGACFLGRGVMPDSGGERSRSIALVVGHSTLMAVDQLRWHASRHTRWPRWHAAEDTHTR
ncbi:hypothetical protein QBC39DRAFT_363726 [Podospora conica]|nr:hypothetical protein QBC39DRAFT_363726 [Schizothecium conicum]